MYRVEFADGWSAFFPVIATETFNVYVDGSWLFSQCRPNGIFANRMEYPDSRFRLSFPKLLDAVSDQLGPGLAPGDLYFYTALFELPENPDPEWASDAENMRPSIEARHRFAEEAVQAGFGSEGIFRVPLRGWIVESVKARRYQEKMVDTAVVARLVERSIKEPEILHVLLSGDSDMIPAIQTVVPNYSETVVVACTHPDQYLPQDRQSSYRLAQFDLRRDPIYLDQLAERIVEGDFVYRCCNPRCNAIFARPKPIPAGANPRCRPCFETQLQR